MMKKMSISYFLLLCVGVVFGLTSCNQPTESTAEEPTPEPQEETVAINVKADQHVETQGSITPLENGGVRIADGESWLSFELTVPVAGRYKFELDASTQSDSVFAWMEDYIDNKDGRTYNITGSIPISANQAASIDGSPLNKGVHKMKLHIKGAADVQSFRFSLLREHQLTPETKTQKMDGEEWKIAWSDEFNGEGIPDTTKWTFDLGDWGWGNNELQYYTEKRPENARQEDGNLIIEARKNDMGKAWTSARLTTRGKVTFKYGRIEFRAKVPVTRGNWAAGWTLGDDYVDELSWPYCGEIDILESVGYEIDDATGNGKAHASIHCGAYYFKLGNQPTSDIPVENMEKEFHTYAVDWSPEGIIAYVDGQEYFRYSDTSTELAWPYDRPQNLILNLAIGGGWGGLQGVDENMTSQKFILDYVRVYEKI